MKLSRKATSLHLSKGLARYVDDFRSASLLSKLTLIGLGSAVVMSLLFAISRAGDTPYGGSQPELSQQGSKDPASVSAQSPQAPAGAGSENAGVSVMQQLTSSRLEQWRQSWEQRNADLHLSFFHPGFENLAVYSQNRRKRIQEAKSIVVSLNAVSFKSISESEIAVTFVQSYRSDRFSDRVRKEQVWRSAANGPLIVSEKVSAPRVPISRGTQ